MKNTIDQRNFDESIIMTESLAAFIVEMGIYSELMLVLWKHFKFMGGIKSVSYALGLKHSNLLL